MNEFGGFPVPGGDVINLADLGVFGISKAHVGLLLNALIGVADEGRVADDKVDVRREIFPVDAQGVLADDVAVSFERESVEVNAKRALGLLEHLVFGNPQGSLRDGHRERINFNAVELID